MSVVIDELPPHIDEEAVQQRARRFAQSESLEAPDSKQEAEPYFSFIHADELAEGDFHVNYLIPGVLAERQSAIIAGQFKTLKTSIGLDIALALASGTRLLDRFNVPQRKRTLLLTAESGLATVKETCLRICDSMGINLGDQKDYFTVTDRVPRLQNLVHVGELSEYVKANGYQVIIADPAYLMLDGSDAGNVFSMGDQLRVFRDIATDAEATPILIHHAKKNNTNAIEYRPLELVDLAWAGFAEFARQWILLSRRDRYEEGSGQHRLWMSVGGSAGHNGCWGIDVDEGTPEDPMGRHWNVSVTDAQTARRDAADEAHRKRQEVAEEKEQRTIDANREKVISAFRGIRPPLLTKSKICDRAGLSKATASKAIAYMLRVGELTDGEQVKSCNGQTYDGYRLNVGDADD